MSMHARNACAATATILSIVASLALAGCSTHPTPKEARPAMSQHTSSVEVVKGFFAAFGKGDVDGVVAAFHPRAQIVAVRKAPRKDGGVYGAYSGQEGARAFVASLGGAFDTQAFAVDVVVGEGNVAFASGSFTHKLKSTGKLFSSDWALKCVVEEGRILEYHFYEDSAAYAEASRTEVSP